MRIYFIGLVGAVLGFISCSKSSTDLAPEFNIEQSWTIGAEHSMDTFLNVPTSASGTAELAIETYSICPTHQVQLTVADDANQVIFETISDTLAIETFAVSKSINQVRIQAKLIEHKQDVACVWLGQAKLVYRYVE